MLQVHFVWTHPLQVLGSSWRTLYCCSMVWTKKLQHVGRIQELAQSNDLPLPVPVPTRCITVLNIFFPCTGDYKNSMQTSEGLHSIKRTGQFDEELVLSMHFHLTWKLSTGAPV